MAFDAQVEKQESCVTVCGDEPAVPRERPRCVPPRGGERGLVPLCGTGGLWGWARQHARVHGSPRQEVWGQELQSLGAGSSVGVQMWWETSPSPSFLLAKGPRKGRAGIPLQCLNSAVRVAVLPRACVFTYIL